MMLTFKLQGIEFTVSDFRMQIRISEDSEVEFDFLENLSEIDKDVLLRLVERVFFLEDELLQEFLKKKCKEVSFAIKQDDKLLRDVIKEIGIGNVFRAIMHDEEMQSSFEDNISARMLIDILKNKSISLQEGKDLIEILSKIKPHARPALVMNLVSLFDTRELTRALLFEDKKAVMEEIAKESTNAEELLDLIKKIRASLVSRDL